MYLDQEPNAFAVNHRVRNTTKSSQILFKLQARFQCPFPLTKLWIRVRAHKKNVYEVLLESSFEHECCIMYYILEDVTVYNIDVACKAAVDRLLTLWQNGYRFIYSSYVRIHRGRHKIIIIVTQISGRFIEQLSQMAYYVSLFRDLLNGCDKCLKMWFVYIG